MASNPWEILNANRLNLPAIMEGAAVAKQRRLQEMMLNRQIEKEDREAERENKLLGIYAKIRQPGSQTSAKGGDPASSSVGGGVQQAMVGAPSPDMSVPSGSPLSPERAPAPAAPGMGGPAPAPDPVVVQSWMEANKDVINELMLVAPDKAFAMSEQLSKLDDTQFKRVKDLNEVRGSVAMHLQSFPPQRRQGELARMMPQLAQMGITPQVVQQELGDLSDEALQAPVALSMDVEKILAQQDKDRAFAETQRHNRASEANAAGNLNIRREALNVARDREKRVAAGKGAGDLSNATTDALLSAAGL